MAWFYSLSSMCIFPFSIYVAKKRHIKLVIIITLSLSQGVMRDLYAMRGRCISGHLYTYRKLRCTTQISNPLRHPAAPRCTAAWSNVTELPYTGLPLQLRCIVCERCSSHNSSKLAKVTFSSMCKTGRYLLQNATCFRSKGSNLLMHTG